MMKTAIAVLLPFFSFSSLWGQSIAWTSSEQMPLGYSPISFSQLPAHKRMCGAAKAGLITVGSGIVIGCTGMAFMLGNLGSKGHNTNGDNAHMGTAMFVAGGFIEIIGGALVLGGGIHDHMQKRKVSFAASSGNEIGITYNFQK